MGKKEVRRTDRLAISIRKLGANTNKHRMNLTKNHVNRSDLAAIIRILIQIDTLVVVAKINQ